MSYSSPAKWLQEYPESSPYLSRYQSRESSVGQYDDFDTPSVDSSLFDSPQDPQGSLKRLAQGQGSDENSPDYLQELDALQGDVSDSGDDLGLPVDLEGGKESNPEDLKKAIQDFQAEIENSQASNSMKEEYSKKAADLDKQLKAGQLDNPAEIDDLKSEFEEFLNDNPSQQQQLITYLKDQGVKTSDSAIKDAMKKNGFTDESLSHLSLPGDSNLQTRLMKFIRAINPDYNKEVTRDPQKGFSPSNLKKLAEMLLILDPQNGSMDNAVNLVDTTDKSRWNSSDVKGKITGDRCHGTDGEKYNNRWFDADAFVDRMYNYSTGTDASDIAGYLKEGWNACDNGARNKGVEIRQFLSGLFEVCQHNPYLFRHYLKKIPDTALVSMKAVLDYRGGGGNDDGTKDTGERWNTLESAHVLNWAINGGVPPSELDSELLSEINGPAQSSATPLTGTTGA